jgi:hypothetical protein
LQNLIKDRANEFTPVMWDLVRAAFARVLEQNRPYLMLKLSKDEALLAIYREHAPAKANEKESNKDSHKESNKESHKDSSKESSKESHKESSKESSKESHKESHKDVKPDDSDETVDEKSEEKEEEEEEVWALKRKATVTKRSRNAETAKNKQKNTIRGVNFIDIQKKAGVELLLIEILSQLVRQFSERLTLDSKLAIVSVLEGTCSFFGRICQDAAIAQHAKNQRIFDELVNIENQSFAAAVDIVFTLGHDEPHQKAFEMIDAAVKAFLQSEYRAPQIAVIFRCVNSLPNEQFLSHLSQLYPLLLQLVLATSLDVRKHLAAFLQRVGAHFNLSK